MKILEICPYSAGICGVWTRAKQESLEFKKQGDEIMVFSSNLEKGTDKIIASEENFKGIKIKRFASKKIGGESFMLWLNNKAVKKALEYSPDIIICHNYRHLHTTKALKIRDALIKQDKKCKIFLVTHAPFVEGNITRTKFQTTVVNFYDRFIGPKTLNKFDKILVISHWEIPHLLNAGAKEDKIVYIPNGIPEELFNVKNSKKEENKVLFLGRIAPKKMIETIIRAIPFVKDKTVKFEIVGPPEQEYKNKLNQLVKVMNVSNRIVFSPPVYDLQEKINKLDSCKIYVLASRVEGMPQGLIEAMARGKIIIGSNSIAIRDLIQDKKNGYLFEFNNPQDLAKKIDLALVDNKTNKDIRKEAKKFVEIFSWPSIIKSYNSLFKQK